MNGDDVAVQAPVSFTLNQGETVTATFKSGGGSMELRLRVPTTSERWRLAHAAKLGGANPRYSKMLEDVAREWWVGFSGAVDSSGEPLLDSETNRFRLLQASQKLTGFVIETLTADDEKEAEGNADSASA